MEVKPGYKQTEVGVIPEEWEVKTLNSISIISRLAGAEYTSLWEETPNGEIIALRGFNIGQGKIIERDLVRISNRLSLKLKRSRLCKGDVVYPCVGSIGNAVVITDDAKYHIQQNIARITPNPDAIDSDYLANFLMSWLAEREVDRFTSSSSQPSVLVGSLRQYRVPLPTLLPEQRAIAAALSDVDGLLDGLDRLIAKKRDLKQAAMQQLLTGQTRLPGFHGEWEVKRLGSIAEVLKGKVLSKSLVSASGTRPCILYGELFTTYGRLISEIVGRTSSSEGCLSVSGDVLMPGSTTTTGADLATASALLVDDVALGGDIIVIRSKDREYDPVFLANYLTQARRREIAELTQGITIHHLYGKDVRTLALRLPSHAEQTAIATVLSEMDGELAVLEQRREKTRALKQAMMQELLTGRTRLV